jgi:hypothetical protein
MTLCLLVYKLAELRVRQRLAARGQTVPDQVRKPTVRPTLRWFFQCFEGIGAIRSLEIAIVQGMRGAPLGATPGGATLGAIPSPRGEGGTASSPG